MTTATQQRRRVRLPRANLLPGPARSRRGRVVAWVLVLGLVGFLLGGLVTAVATTRYLSRAAVQVTPLPGNAFSDRSGATLAPLTTEAQLPTSDAVLEKVASGSASASVEGLRSRVSGSVREGTEVIVVGARGASESQARTLADKVAAALLAVRADRAATVLSERAAELTAQVGEAEADLTTAMAQGRDSAEVHVLSRRLANLSRELSAVSAQVPNPGAVVEVTTARDPSSVRRTVLGAVLGAALGALVGLWVGRGGARARGPRLRRRRW